MQDTESMTDQFLFHFIIKEDVVMSPRPKDVGFVKHDPTSPVARPLKEMVCAHRLWVSTFPANKECHIFMFFNAAYTTSLFKFRNS